MRGLLVFAAAAAVAVVSWGAQGSSTPKGKAPAKSTASTGSAASKKPVSSRPATSNTRTAQARTTTGSRTARRPVTSATWRQRQAAPAPERYKEIQEALAARGYLSPEEANGAWNTSSTEALKRFQSEQSLESNGKINSLSLIALGLGPKHDATAVLPAAPAPQPVPEGNPPGR